MQGSNTETHLVDSDHGAFGADVAPCVDSCGVVVDVRVVLHVRDVGRAQRGMVPSAEWLGREASSNLEALKL